jgi:hypothetical protein
LRFSCIASEVAGIIGMIHHAQITVLDIVLGHISCNFYTVTTSIIKFDSQSYFPP